MPVTTIITAVSAIAAIAGTGMAVMSSVQQGQAQKRAGEAQAAGYRAQAEASKYNSDMARQNAEYIRQAGAIEEEKQREKGQRLLGTQQALYGKAGVTNEGTPLEVMASTAADLEKDALTTRYNYWIQSQRANSEAANYDFMSGRSLSMGDYADTSAGYASTAGYMKAGTSLLTGLGSVASIGAKYYGTDTSSKMTVPQIDLTPKPWTYPGMAKGGPVEAGQSYAMGEKGPEILTQGAGNTQIVGANGPEVVTPTQDGTVLPNNVLQEALKQYPILQKVGVKGVTTDAPGKYGDIESWPAGETGETGYMRPQELPIDSFGVQVFNGGKTKPIDVLADVASHHMVKTDPQMKQYYQDFKDSLTDYQKEKLQRDYQHDKETMGEKRPFEQWAEASRLPAYFRGYTFNQWPKEWNDKFYTPEQKKLLDGVREYLGVKGNKK